MTDHEQTINTFTLQFQWNDGETKKQQDHILVGGRDQLSMTV